MVEPVRDSELIVVEGGRIYHLGLTPDQIAKQVLVVGDPARADLVAGHFDSVKHEVGNREYVTRTGTYNGMPVTVIATGIGTDNNEITLVEAFGLNEFDLEQKTRNEGAEPLTVIRIGTSGGPQEDVELGTLAIAKYGLGLDNTGMFYEFAAPDGTVTRIEDEAYRILTEATPDDRRFKGKLHPYASKLSPEVVEALAKHAVGDSVVGITASSSGFYGCQGREIPGLPITVPGLQEHLAELDVDGNRVVNFEMETSLLGHLTGLMGYRGGTICAVIANRPRGTFMEDYSPAIHRAIETALDAMFELYGKER